MLKIENLNVYYGGVHALKGISIDVPKGQVVTLIGSNGAGKSSTLRSICGLVEPEDGKIIYDGEYLGKTPSYDRVKLGIAMVPEGRRVFTNLTVYENLLMGAYTRTDKNGIQEDFKKVFQLFPRLEERKSQRAMTLSGGEQQMLAVGRAMMSNPKLLLMDEPSLGLAPNLIADMYKTITRIHEQGVTIMLIEQNASFALKLADYGYVMEVGNIAVEGPASELKDNEEVKRAYIGA